MMWKGYPIFILRIQWTLVVVLLLVSPIVSASSPPCCRLFVWDAPSACRYHLCKHLVKDCIYEGLRGKFVRIPPNSILELLYPCNQHSPDRCLLCGRSFQEHLELRCRKDNESPYSKHLDTVYEQGNIHRVLLQDKAQTKHQHSAKQKSNNQSTIVAYHQHYLETIQKKKSKGVNTQNHSERTTLFFGIPSKCALIFLYTVFSSKLRQLHHFERIDNERKRRRVNRSFI